MDNLIQVLIQGGAVGIALVALWMNYKGNNGKFMALMELIAKNADTNTRLSCAIESLEKTVHSKL